MVTVTYPLLPPARPALRLQHWDQQCPLSSHRTRCPTRASSRPAAIMHDRHRCPASAKHSKPRPPRSFAPAEFSCPDPAAVPPSITPYVPWHVDVNVNVNASLAALAQPNRTTFRPLLPACLPFVLARRPAPTRRWLLLVTNCKFIAFVPTARHSLCHPFACNRKVRDLTAPRWPSRHWLRTATITSRAVVIAISLAHPTLKLPVVRLSRLVAFLCDIAKSIRCTYEHQTSPSAPTAPLSSLPPEKFSAPHARFPGSQTIVCTSFRRQIAPAGIPTGRSQQPQQWDCLHQCPPS